MKVLHVFKTYYPDSIGGVERIIYELCTSSYDGYTEKHVLSMSKDKSLNRKEFDSHYIHSVKKQFRLASMDISISLIKKFKELVKEVDIVHYHFPWPLMDILYLIAGHKKKSIVTYHADITKQKWLNIIYQPLMHLFLRRVNMIVATSPNYLNTSKVLQKYRSKVTVIPLGIPNIECSSDTVLLESWRNKIGFNQFFVFSGALRYYKGLHFLLSAIQNTELCVVIVGTGTEEASLKEQAVRLKLNNNIIFLGALSEEDKLAVIELSLGFVFPSHLRSEAFGVALLEAARQKKPLITTEIGSGMSYVNIHGETGLVVPPEDPVALRGAMLELWGNSDKCKIFGDAAHQRFLEHFTSDNMCQKYLYLYDNLIGS